MFPSQGEQAHVGILTVFGEEFLRFPGGSRPGKTTVLLQLKFHGTWAPQKLGPLPLSMCSSECFVFFLEEGKERSLILKEDGLFYEPELNSVAHPEPSLFFGGPPKRFSERPTVSAAVLWVERKSAPL